MYARNLERILARLCVKSDPSHAVIAQEYEDRFNSLRGYGRLPRGREQREQKLSNKEIASAIFGLVAQRPSWAGHVAIILESLCPVGGTNASFFDAATLGEAVQILLTSEEARKSLVRLSLTASETGVSSNGGAELIYEADGAKRHVHFVHKMVISLAQPGAENGFDPDRRLLAPVTREMTFINHSSASWRANANWPRDTWPRPKAMAPNTTRRKRASAAMKSSASGKARAS